MSKKICILTQSHLCRNPRVVKEANALAAAGYDVSILTTFTYANLLEEDLKLIDSKHITYRGVVNMIAGEESSYYRLKERFKRRFAGELISRFGWEQAGALGYDYHRNFRAALKEKADLYICHQEVSTVIGCKLIEKGFKVAFDFEDWYSHDLLPEANRSRPISLLEKSEKFALRNGVLTYTTSESLASALAAFAETSKPKVLHNVFPLKERDLMDGRLKDRQDLDKPSLHWYSQTIGPGRGLEFLIESLHEIEIPLDLHLRGNIFGSYDQVLSDSFPVEKGHRIFFHPLVPHLELLSRIAEHDIGLAMEEYVPDSRNLTITNKILQYLLAGIAVLATDTEGQKEVGCAAPDAVILFRNQQKDDFVQSLNQLLNDKQKLQFAKMKALEIANEKYCWEKQAPMLVQWVHNVLN